MCLVGPSLQTFPTSELQWAGSGRKYLLVKRHHYIRELYIEAFLASFKLLIYHLYKLFSGMACQKSLIESYV
jgi:hypothetical protein